MAVPTHWPPLVQVSLNEQALPSSHAAAVGADAGDAGVGGAGVLVAAIGGRRAGGAALDRGVVADAAVAGVVGAGIVVVAVGYRRAGRAVRDRRVLADAAIAGVGGAGILVVAVGGRGAEPAAGDQRVLAHAGLARVRRAGVLVVAVGCFRTDRTDADAVLARVSAGLVLIAVVHHELEAIGVPHDHPARGDEVVHVPAHLGAVALALQARGGGVPGTEVPAVLRRV